MFDESLNFRKIPPVVNAKTPDGNIRPNDPKPQTTDVPEPPTITRRRTWSRDEVRIHILFKELNKNYTELLIFSFQC